MGFKEKRVVHDAYAEKQFLAMNKAWTKLWLFQHFASECFNGIYVYQLFMYNHYLPFEIKLSNIFQRFVSNLVKIGLVVSSSAFKK